MTHTTTRVPVRQDPTADRPPRGHRVVIGWLLLTAALAAAGVLILVVTSSGPAPQRGTTPIPHSSVPDTATLPQHGVYSGWPAGVPRSADAAERWFAQQHQAPAGWPKGIHRSADAAERWFAQQHQAPAGWPKGIHRSADAAERWFARQQ